MAGVLATGGRAGGVEVTVGVGPEPGAGTSAVLLSLGAPAREAAPGVRLGPGQAHRLAAALSAAAFAAAGCPPGGAAPTGPAVAAPTRPDPDSEPGTELTEVIAVAGTAAELAGALAVLPPGVVLIDFAADAEVSLFFGPPAAAGPAARTWPAPA